MTPWYLNKNQKSLKIFIHFIVVLIFGLGILSKPALAIEEKVFGGKIDFIGKNLTFNLDLKEDGALAIKGGISNSGEYHLSLKLRHFRFARFDILTDLQTAGRIRYAEDGRIRYLQGSAWSQASLLNYKPFKEFRLSYEFDKDKIKINSLSWADINLKGQVILKPALSFDMVLSVTEADIKDLAEIIGFNDLSLASFEGRVTGSLKIDGEPGALKVYGKLVARDGRIASIDFSSARINLEGNWPILRFVNSYINGSDGLVYGLRGQFNLEELPNPGCPEHKVIVYTANNAMRFQDWVIKRQTDPKGDDTLEAEYSLKKNQALKMRIKNESEILAWEKSIKF